MGITRVIRMDTSLRNEVESLKQTVHEVNGTLSATVAAVEKNAEEMVKQQQEIETIKRSDTKTP